MPGLNCYSCPGALGSCPIGSLQAVLGSREYNFAFYIVGFLLLAGAAFLLPVDNLSRNLLATEIPIGILTAFTGAPFFLYLMLRKGGAR